MKNLLSHILHPTYWYSIFNGERGEGVKTASFRHLPPKITTKHKTLKSLYPGLIHGVTQNKFAYIPLGNPVNTIC
jgi:hypothetical protein